MILTERMELYHASYGLQINCGTEKNPTNKSLRQLHKIQNRQYAF